MFVECSSCMFRQLSFYRNFCLHFFSCPFIVVVLAIFLRLKWERRAHFFSMNECNDPSLDWMKKSRMKFSFSLARVSWPIFPTLKNLPGATVAFVDSEHYRLSAAKWIMNAIDWKERARHDMTSYAHTQRPPPHSCTKNAFSICSFMMARCLYAVRRLAKATTAMILSSNIHSR